MLRVVWNIIKTLISLIFKVFSPFKRLVCRRRKNSDSGIIPVGNHLSTYDSTTIDMMPVPDSSETELQSWDSWGIDDTSRKSHTGHMAGHVTASNYRQKRLSEPEPEPEIDYFQDLTPDFKKAPKILLKKKDEPSINKTAISNRLAVSSDIPIPGSELGSWEDEGNAWGDEAQEDLSWQAEAAMKEKRRLERQERTMEQQRKKHERDMKGGQKRDSHMMAVRLS
ncbi:receptor-binding cancer antigen expressed on SiSo cells-like [Haliotis cracherodii]|uniref:receptor-binding cancer antigen expressed on SiSo cells-like n=1 Tax=Haliotis cracherodii TaxID=6455 RepID=UPI0039EA3573